MSAIEERLVALGDDLDVMDDGVVDSVLARLDERPVAAGGAGGPLVALRLAAALVIAVALAVVAIPDARRTVAGWFSWDGVSVERRPDLDPPATTTPLAGDADAGEVVTVDGRDVFVSTVDARLDVGLVRKTLGPDSGVVETTVGGRPALWIHGEPHLVSFFTADGSVIDERVAGDTLLWQEGEITRRVEGFDELADAVAYAERAFADDR